MKNRLLFSTALVAVLSATNVYAEDWTINSAETIENTFQRKDNVTVKSGAEVTISGDTESGIIAKNFTMEDGSLTASSTSGSTDTGVFVKGNGDVELKGGNIELTNARIAKGDDVETTGDMNISGGKITLNKDAYLEMYDKNTGNVNMTGGELVLNENSAVLLNTDENQDVVSNADKFIMNGQNAKLTANGNNKITGDVDLQNGNINVSGDLTIANNFNMTGGSVSIDGSDAKFSDMLAQNSQIDGGTINLNYGHLGVNEALDITGGDINMNVGEIDAQTVNVSGGKINMIGETGLSGSTIAISGGEITQQGTQQDRSGIWGTSTISGDAVINMKGYASIDENSTLSINGGTINVSGTDNVFGSVNDVAMSGGELNIAQGADLSLHKLESTMPDAAYGTGRIFLNEGRINLGGTINGDITGSDRGKIYFENSSAKIDGNVDSASLIFKNSHTLSEAITGELGGLDIFEIQKGTLVYDKNIESGASSVVVDSGATLDIGTNALHSGGEKEVEGEGVFFKDNSTLKFALTDKDTYGKIYANYVNISENGTTLDLSLNGAALSEGDNPLIIKLFNGEDLAEAEIEGKFANLTTNSRYDFTDNEDGTYTVTSNGTTASDIVSGAGGTSSNASTAEAWDSVSAEKSSPVAAAVTEKLAELSNSTDAASQKAYIDALTAVAPEVAPMVQKTQTETANQVFGAVSTRLTGGSVSTGGEGMSSGDSVFERAAMWVQGLFNKSKLDDTSKSYGFDADSSGVAMGAEKYVTEDTKLGLGYAYTNTDIDGFMRSTDVDTHTAFVYGEYKPSNWYVNGIMSYGWSDYSENKNVSGIGVKADYDAETFGLQAMTGYDMQLKHFGLTPEVGLRYVHISQDGYTDSADQKVSGNDSDILTGVIGAKVSKTWTLENGMNIKPEARIAATYDLMNDDVNSVVTLANGSAYMVEGDALDRFGMEFGAGVTAEVNDNVELSLGYEGKFREDYQDHTGLLNAKYKF